jgi:hypothetical protein
VTVFAATWCYALLAWVLLELGLKAWRAPWRIVGLLPGGMVGTLPVRIEPGEIVWQAAAGPPESGMVPMISSNGAPYWYAAELLRPVVDPVHVGATEEWSPIAEAAAATAGRLPLDDVDEWLAGRLRDYDHQLSRIESSPRLPDGQRASFRVLIGEEPPEGARTVTEELERFRQGSMALHEYRSMILESTGGYTMREAALVEALVLAAA